MFVVTWQQLTEECEAVTKSTSYVSWKWSLSTGEFYLGTLLIWHINKPLASYVRNFKDVWASIKPLDRRVNMDLNITKRLPQSWIGMYIIWFLMLIATKYNGVLYMIEDSMSFSEWAQGKNMYFQWWHFFLNFGRTTSFFVQKRLYRKLTLLVTPSKNTCWYWLYILCRQSM